MNDNADTRRALIRAAHSLFARHGYAATSVRAITQAADANLGAITYHFGSKRELYDAVVGAVVESLADRIEAVCLESGPAPARIEGVVRAYFAYLAENPELPQLMMQELVLSAEPPAAVSGPMVRVLGALRGLIEDGQAAGTVRPGPPLLQSLFILSVPVHLGLLRRPLESKLGLDLLGAEMRASATEAAVAFVRAGLCEGGGG
jgi:AcrR family transcriptional regulator